MGNLKSLEERCNDLYEEDHGDYTIVHIDKEVIEACLWLIDRYEKALKDISVNCDSPAFRNVAKRALRVNE